MIGRPGTVYNLGPVSLQFVDVAFLKANAPYAVQHKLNRTDVGWIVVSKDRFADLREGPLPRARGSITLHSDTASVQTTILVVAVNPAGR
jgi:hypothetical protein